MADPGDVVETKAIDNDDVARQPNSDDDITAPPPTPPAPRVVFVVGAKGTGIAQHCEMLVDASATETGSVAVTTLDTGALAGLASAIDAAAAAAAAQAQAEADAAAVESKEEGAEEAVGAVGGGDGDGEQANANPVTENNVDGEAAGAETTATVVEESQLVQNLRKVCLANQTVAGGAVSVSLVQVTPKAADDICDWVQQSNVRACLLACLRCSLVVALV